MSYKKVNILIYDDKFDACYNIAEKFKLINTKGLANIAISGGSSPILLFEIMRDHFQKENFNNINFFWVDERYVEKEDPESNFGNFYNILIKTNIIDINKVFPMYKKNNRDETILEIETTIKSLVKRKGRFPQFDLVILGLGNDGHTASLFPDNIAALSSNEIIIKTENPYSHQKRLTLTKSVINNAKAIDFLVFGESKANKVYEVLEKKYKDLPTSYIKQDNSVSWYLDRKSAEKIYI
ncbi:MAG: 6-phosphogluconolactonase [Pleomorphochaeta sp.]